LSTPLADSCLANSLAENTTGSSKGSVVAGAVR
jgi:hypothetical protein